MIAALPLAVVVELGSMLLPVPVFVMFTTGDEVKNLQTPITVALTVTLTLSLACAEPASKAAAAVAMSIKLLIRLAFMLASPQMVGSRLGHAVLVSDSVGYEA